VPVAHRMQPQCICSHHQALQALEPQAPSTVAVDDSLDAQLTHKTWLVLCANCAETASDVDNATEGIICRGPRPMVCSPVSLRACLAQLRLNKVSELIHNSTHHQDVPMARVSVHFIEIIDKVRQP